MSQGCLFSRLQTKFPASLSEHSRAPFLATKQQLLACLPEEDSEIDIPERLEMPLLFTLSTSLLAYGVLACLIPNCSGCFAPVLVALMP